MNVCYLNRHYEKCYYDKIFITCKNVLFLIKCNYDNINKLLSSHIKNIVNNIFKSI